MNSKQGAKRERWSQFYHFIDGASPPAPLSALRMDLENMGVDVTRVDIAVSQITALGRTHVREGWLERARKAQTEFEQSFKRKSSWLSQEYGNARDILTAIASGSLGSGVQQQARVFFRNKDLNSASETDLRSFLDDCELLGLLSPPAKNSTSTGSGSGAP
jgi:hypothetical protein